jgi:hypothetical protein
MFGIPVKKSRERPDKCLLIDAPRYTPAIKKAVPNSVPFLLRRQFV